MKTTLFAALFSIASAASVASADPPCREGGSVATSRNGSVRVVSSAWGCRAYPDRTFTIEGRTRSYTITGAPPHEHVFVSDTGRTVLFVEEHVRADQHSVAMFRDGYRLGVYPVSELVGAQHRVVTEGLHVETEIDGVELVIRDLQGNEVLRRHLRFLAYRR
ncbi:MAG: hypothetical protein AAGF12_21655 [Myxococcota bacterium]